MFGFFLFAAQRKEFFFDGLENSEKRSHNCVGLGGICRVSTFLFSIP
jgi:vancomycin resistance protein YoaR